MYRNQKCDIFIGGDLNVDMKHMNSQDSKKLNNFLKLSQLKQKIDKVTRPDSNAMLDLIITNCDIVKECSTLDINVSDHLPIYLIRKKVKSPNEKIDFKGRSYKNLNKDTVENMLRNVDWTTFANSDVDSCWNYLLENVRKYDIEPFDQFDYITEDELVKEIKNISIYKSSGLNISTYFLKICFEILTPQLLVILNKSLFNGYFPIGWRKATVVPIPKVNIPEEIGDLRPIALTPLPGKILERFVHTQLLRHLNRHNILTDFQNGFRKNHSTIDTFFKYTTDLQLNKNNNLHTIALYIDFKKAFDTVNHKLLIDKLKDMKIENKVLKWIKSYLTNRSQSTRIGSITSTSKNVCTGVPQGSILGPLFFLGYINDITQICSNTNILLYADDTVLYKAISDNERFFDMHNFQQDVNRLVVWCQRNRLSINVKKTKLVFYPASQNAINDVNNVINMQETAVDYVSSYLYLGVDIDNMLTFKKHFSNTFKSVSHKLFILRKIRYMINTKAALDVAKTMLCSIIDYGNIFLSSLNEAELNDLQILQNNAIRCCYQISDPRDEHILDLHVRANMKLVNTRRQKQILTCLWRNIQKGVVIIKEPVRLNGSAMAPTIYLPIPRTTLFKKSVFYLGATLWNALPRNVRSCDDIDNI